MLQKHVSWNLGELYVVDDPTKIDDVGNKHSFATLADDYQLPDVFYFHTTQPTHYPYKACYSCAEVATITFHEPDYSLQSIDSDFED